MYLRTLEQISNSGMKPIFASWFSFTVLIFISPLDADSFPDTVFLSIGRGRGNSWSNFSIRAIPILVNQLKNCRTSHLPRLNRLFLQWTNQFIPSFWKLLLGHFQVLGGENPYFKFLLIPFTVARLSVNGNVQPQYAAQRSIAGCTVFTAFAFYSILPR